MLDPHAPNLVPVHCTHVPPLHTLLPTVFEHSASAVHALHAPALHADAVGLVQSACFRHATHCSVVVSQNGFVMSLQSVVAAHSTQVLVVVSQAGFGAVHVDSSMHSTQVLVAVLQADFGLAHVEWSMHSTQVFVEIRQTEVVPVHAPSHGAPTVPALPASPLIPDAPAPMEAPLAPPARVPDTPPEVPPAAPPFPEPASPPPPPLPPPPPPPHVRSSSQVEEVGPHAWIASGPLTATKINPKAVCVRTCVLPQKFPLMISPPVFSVATGTT